MANLHPPEFFHAPRSHAEAPPPPRGRSWLFERLDGLLSESLRAAAPSELTRHRIVVGAACFLLTCNTVFLVRSLQVGMSPYATLFAGLGYVLTLVLARRGRTSTPPALVLLVTVMVGLVGSVFVNPNPNAGEHAMNVLLPVLAVYLVGPRLGLPLTLILIGVLGLVHPAYRVHAGLDPSAITPSNIWFGHVFAGLSFLGAWALGALHSTARDAVQASREHTLRELRDSESKLNSVFESTDDFIVSLDTRGRLLTANSAARRLCLESFGIRLEPGLALFELEAVFNTQEWQTRLAEAYQGQRLRYETVYTLQGRQLLLDINAHPIQGPEGQVTGVTLFGRDVTSRREAENRLGEMHRTLVDVSRQAGMAEIATGVLHNVGNTLNSVNISTHLVTDRLRKSRVTSLAKVADLLREHLADLPTFLVQEARGQQLPPYLIALATQLQEERDAMLQEMRALEQSVEHISSIVTMQQKHARAAGAVEQLSVPQLIDEALRLHAVSFERLNIQVERDYAPVPVLFVDRHKLLQILINLLSNARHALVDSANPAKRLGIHVGPAAEPGHLRITVSDNGVGIAPENLGRLFSQGFTTKKKGHGFGLHISALAAEEMNGRLTCTSPGLAQGATFTLELPPRPEPSAPLEPA